MASRTQKSTYNLITSVGAQVWTVFLSFLSRSVFIHSLDARYLGINGLFTNIISLLSLAELGVGTALIYSMYKPLANNDTKKLAALTQFYRKLYFYIGAIIAGVGLVLFPFLGYFINLDVGIQHVEYYYLLFLIQSVSSYFMVYRTSIMIADQKAYVLNRNTMIINTVATIIQMFVLLLWKNYAIYLLVIVVFNIFGNYYNSRVAQTRYPYITQKESLSLGEKRDIWSNIQSMFLYKMGGVLLNNIDNVLISKIVGTIEVGLYSNYSLIINKVGNMTSLIFTSMQASLGNFNVDSSEEEKSFLFDTMSMISFWVYGFCSICFCLLIQDFIVIWIGKEYLLDNATMYIRVANFYLQGVLYPVWCFRNTTGLFKETKYTMLFASVINIIASIFGGIKWGMAGILAATIIARLLTNIWYDPYKLFHTYFKKSVKKYFWTEIVRVIFLIFFVTMSQSLFDWMKLDGGWRGLIIKMFYCVIVVNGIFVLWYRKQKTFQFLCNKILDMVGVRNVKRR